MKKGGVINNVIWYYQKLLKIYPPILVLVSKGEHLHYFMICHRLRKMTHHQLEIRQTERLLKDFVLLGSKLNWVGFSSTQSLKVETLMNLNQFPLNRFLPIPYLLADLITNPLYIGN